MNSFAMIERAIESSILELEIPFQTKCSLFETEQNVLCLRQNKTFFV